MLSHLRRDLITAAIAMLVLTVLLGLVYPLLTTGVSQVIFPGKANGSRIVVKGRVVGSSLIGQDFADPVYRHGKEEMSGGNPVTTPDPRYFQSRPSATDPPDNAEASTFSNLGPNSKATLTAIEANVEAYVCLERNFTQAAYLACDAKPYHASEAAGVPVDAADSSASGLDPDISPANAGIQAHRIAVVRRLPLAQVDRLIGRYTTPRSLGFLGEPGVNVLELNLALNRLTGDRP